MFNMESYFVFAVLDIFTNGIQCYLPRISVGWWQCTFLVMFIAFLWNFSKIKIEQRTINAACISFLITLYFWVVIIITFGTRLPDPHFSYELVPFQSYKQAFVDGRESELFQILCNVLLFIPFGVLFPIWKKNKAENVISFLRYAFCFTFSIELLQLITKIGCFEIDDIINNMIGAMLGYLALHIVRRVKRRCLKMFRG